MKVFATFFKGQTDFSPKTAKLVANNPNLAQPNLTLPNQNYGLPCMYLSHTPSGSGRSWTSVFRIWLIIVGKYLDRLP